MQYRKLELEDIGRIKPWFSEIKSRTCDFSVGGMFMWRHFFQMEICDEAGVIYTRLYNKGSNCPYYNIPFGGEFKSAVDHIIEADESCGGLFRFCTIPEIYLEDFKALGYPTRIYEQPEYADYLYMAEDLANMAGRRYSGQRNQIHKFTRAYEDWSYTDFTKEDTEAVKAFFMTFTDESGNTQLSAIEENHMVHEVLDNMDIYQMHGGILRVGSQIVGFSLGEVIGDTLYDHIEKADRDYQGVYQMLANQTAMHYGADVTYINREEAMGDPGLIKSKESYHPTELLKKYVVEIMA